ncbi:MAG: hypothetical protein AUJ72_03765 [Candidatus Omnitrophica bacterium CG1_02_46_14]|nr:MAG: hypothetical protein AUJ72_03765 [Candidatus Omnitrophica bacterium CG1_02_46_14]
MISAFIASIALGLSIALLIQYFGPGGELEKVRNIQKRILSDNAAGASDSPLLKKHDNLSDLEIVKNILRRYEPSKKIASLLRTLKIKISVSILFLICILLFILTFTVLKSKAPIILAFLGALFMGGSPLFVLNFLHKQRLAKFGEYLPNALSIISSSIKVGHGLQAAIEGVAKSAPHPVCDEFNTVISEVQLGLSLPEALDNLYARIHSPELKIFVTGLSIHQDLGGNLSEVLDNLEKTIRSRFALLREIDTLSSQGKFSAWVLFSIPFALIGIYLWRTHDLFMSFARSGYGQTVLWICFSMQIAGFIGINKVIKLKD